MEKNIRVGRLLDIYGALLPEKQRELIDLSCNEDLSLSEISEASGLTRQGVHDSIRRGELQLESYEQKLGLLQKHISREEQLTLLLAILQGVKGYDTDRELINACEIVMNLLQKEE